jgi:hypothetical protein
VLDQLLPLESLSATKQPRLPQGSLVLGAQGTTLVDGRLRLNQSAPQSFGDLVRDEDLIFDE